MLRDRHLPGGPADCELDQHVPLEIGGHSTDPRNLRSLRAAGGVQESTSEHSRTILEGSLQTPNYASRKCADRGRGSSRREAATKNSFSYPQLRNLGYPSGTGQPDLHAHGSITTFMESGAIDFWTAASTCSSVKRWETNRSSG
jgi:hypothetical protein